MTTDSSARAIKSGLGTTVMGCRVRSFAKTGSTMDVARCMAESGCAEGTLIVADTQTSGRGRFNRPWASPPGTNLTFSIVLRPPSEFLRDVNMAATVALVRCIRDVTGLTATAKWPNDVRIDGKKVCGVLVEGVLPFGSAQGRLAQDERASSTGSPRTESSYAVLGIGLNVNYDPTPVLGPPVEATSLATELGRTVSRLDVLRAFLRTFDQLYRTLDAGDSLYQEWRGCLDTLGQHVRVRWGDQIEEGLASDVDRNGDLILRRADGSTVSLNAGEVTFQVSAT
jgi:BirA family biotin operon repressor/biotin-[acetyl-CoA-carboxylase] ligase